MLSIGWTEMLAVAVVALIVVGPRDLPAMLRQVGKLAGSARRMSNEFRSELNKVTALDEISSIRKSVSQPFAEVQKDLTADFNKIGTKGVEPTGVLKQDDPETESVVDDIRAKAGLARDAMSKAAIAKRDAEAAVAAAPKAEAGAAVAATTTKAAAKPKKAAAKPKATGTAKTSAAKTSASKTVASKAASSKASSGKTAAAAKPAASTAKATSKPRAKTAAKKAPKSSAGEA